MSWTLWRPSWRSPWEIVSEELTMMAAPATSVGDGYHEMYSYGIFYF